MKKLLIMLLMLFLTFSVACSGDDDDDSSTQVTPGTTDNNEIAESEEYKSCKSCHGDGGIATSIAKSHYDDPNTKDIEGILVNVSSETSCQACHVKDDANQQHPFSKDTAIHKEWAESGHGDLAGEGWVHYDWSKDPSRASCQMCHTATGFKNFAASPAAYDASKNDFSHLLDGDPATTKDDQGEITGYNSQREVLYCWGCHSDNKGALNNPGAVTHDFSEEGGAEIKLVYGDMGGSNLCVSCHSGRMIGENIKKSTKEDWTDTGFMNSHYLAAGGSILGKTGYHFDLPAGYEEDAAGNWVPEKDEAGNVIMSSENYNNIAEYSHDLIGKGDNGPCVGCHMTSDKPHTFDAVTLDGVGVITAIASKACASCHTDLTASKLEELSLQYEAALEALTAELAAKSIHFSPAYPYFFSEAGSTDRSKGVKNWGETAEVAKNVMGAAFNLNLLLHEPGAYAHNGNYAKKLIWDSIDYLDNGLMDDSVVATLDGDTHTGKDYLEKAKAYLGEARPASGLADSSKVSSEYKGCVSCHAGSGAKSYMADSHITDVSTYINANSATSCQDCHTVDPAAHPGADPVATKPADTVNAAILADWGSSGHGDPLGEAWVHYDWKTRDDCQRCHTPVGFADFIKDKANYDPANSDFSHLNAAQNQALVCTACHSDVKTGVLKTAGQVVESFASGDVTVPDVAGSNLCLNCHLGRQVGDDVKGLTEPDAGWGKIRFVNSHYLTAGGTLYSNNGFEYKDLDYADVAYFGHDKLGTSADGLDGAVGDNGPCVACHMQSDNPHTFEVLTRDESGEVTAINNGQCVTCHDGSHGPFDAAMLNEESHHFHQALEALAAQLTEAGLAPLGGYPYFSPDSWGADENEAKNNMGAAYNYNMLHHEPGAYAHNRYYTKRLIWDSIDWLDNNTMDGSTATTLSNAKGIHAGKDYLTGATTYLGDKRP